MSFKNIKSHQNCLDSPPPEHRGAVGSARVTTGLKDEYSKSPTDEKIHREQGTDSIRKDKGKGKGTYHYHRPPLSTRSIRSVPARFPGDNGVVWGHYSNNGGSNYDHAASTVSSSGLNTTFNDGHSHTLLTSESTNTTANTWRTNSHRFACIFRSIGFGLPRHCSDKGYQTISRLK